ncbi:hypothetical protein [Agrobacterium sp. CG674]
MVDIIDPKWSELDASNNSAAPDGIQGNYAPSTVAPILRGTRAGVKRFYNRINAIYTATGSASALALTFAQAPSGYSKGERIAFFPNATNTGAMTLNINSMGAKSILSADGTPLNAGDITNGQFTEVVYDGTAFRLVTGAGQRFTGTITAGGFSTSGPLTAGATTVLNLTTSGTITTSAGLTISAAAGTDRIVGWKTAGTQRWSAFANASPETGSNVGSDFAVARYADNGNYIDAPLIINRATGNISIEKQLTVKGRLYAGTAGTFLETDGNVVFTGGMTTHGVNLGDALSRKANLANPNFTGVVGLPGVSANEFKQGNADGASYSQHNIAMKGWWGLGMQDHTNAVNGYYDFRSGKWDTKGGFFKNGTEAVYNNGGIYGINISGAANYLKEGGSNRGMTFNWNGQGGQPDWLWGGNDGTSMYVYSPNNFSVKNSAQLGGLAASDYVTKAQSGSTFFGEYTINGTFIDITGLPANIKNISLVFKNLNGTNVNVNPMVQFRTAAGVISSGYLSTTVAVAGSAASASSVNGFMINYIPQTPTYRGVLNLYRDKPGGNNWTVSGIISHYPSQQTFPSGDVALSADINGLRITSTAGNVAFTGTVSVWIER